MMLQCMVLEVVDIATNEVCHLTGRIPAWEWFASRYMSEVLSLHMSREFVGAGKAPCPDLDAWTVPGHLIR